MNERRIGALCVVDGETLVGIFTERDLLNRVVGAQLDPAVVRVKDVMTSPVITCGLRGKIKDCASFMSQKRIRHLPVVDNDKIVGMISTGDALAMEMAEEKALIDHLYQYLHGRV